MQSILKESKEEITPFDKVTFYTNIWPHTIQVEVNLLWLYWPYQCRRCWSRWRWRHHPDHSSGRHSGSLGREPRSGPRVLPSSCCDLSAAPPGWRLRPLDSRQWHRSHTASRSPARLETRRRRTTRRGLARMKGANVFVQHFKQRQIVLWTNWANSRIRILKPMFKISLTKCASFHRDPIEFRLRLYSSITEPLAAYHKVEYGDQWALFVLK